MKTNTKSTIKYYWQAIRRYPWVGALTVLGVVASTLATVIAPLYFKQFFDLLAAGGDRGLLFPALIKTLGMVAIVYVLEWLFWRTSNFLNNIFQLSVIRDLNDLCFQYIHKHSFNFFNNNFIGALVKRINWFSRSFESLSDRLTWELVPLIVRIVFITIVLWGLNFWLGFGVLVWSLIYMIITASFSTFKMKYDLKRNEAESTSGGYLADTMTNNANVKLFNGYEREKEGFHSLNEKVFRLRLFTWNLDAVVEAIQGFLGMVLQLGIFYYAIILWRDGKLSVGGFVLIQSYLISIIMSIWNFGRVFRHVYQDLADAEEMTVMLSTPHEIRDTVTAKPLKIKSGEIIFKDVNFAYHETRSIIKQLNLTIKPGERVAFIGPSGAGKSTIARLILRMYELTAGRITIDGQDITRVTQESLWQSVGFVPQDPILFHRTLRENIRYGRPEATDEEIVEAAKQAYCHNFISTLEQGYDTLVGERGVKLSGGERQRVAIARAILRNAPILVLDEATSSLDSEAEHLIQDALENLMKGKTVIVIAHRLSTIRSADRIIVIDAGGIIEEGSHDQLVKKRSGVYRKLWGLQAGGFIK